MALQQKNNILCNGTYKSDGITFLPSKIYINTCNIIINKLAFSTAQNVFKVITKNANTISMNSMLCL